MIPICDFEHEKAYTDGYGAWQEDSQYIFCR